MDYTSEINTRQTEIIELKNYLNDTDYQAIREYEGGEKMSDEVKRKRSEARARINELEAEVARLEIDRQYEECSFENITNETV